MKKAKEELLTATKELVERIEELIKPQSIDEDMLEEFLAILLASIKEINEMTITIQLIVNNEYSIIEDKMIIYS